MLAWHYCERCTDMSAFHHHYGNRSGYAIWLSHFDALSNPHVCKNVLMAVRMRMAIAFVVTLSQPSDRVRIDVQMAANDAALA